MSLYRIVNTCNFGKDYPNESFLGIQNLKGYWYPMNYPSQERAQQVADALNGPAEEAANKPRYWKVVPIDYQLQPGFEP